MIINGPFSYTFATAVTVWNCIADTIGIAIV